MTKLILITIIHAYFSANNCNYSNTKCLLILSVRLYNLFYLLAYISAIMSHKRDGAPALLLRKLLTPVKEIL